MESLIHCDYTKGRFGEGFGPRQSHQFLDGPAPIEERMREQRGPENEQHSGFGEARYHTSDKNTNMITEHMGRHCCPVGHLVRRLPIRLQYPIAYEVGCKQ